MHAAELLRDLVILLAASLPIVFVFQRIRVPPLVGFLVAGFVIGPFTTGLIDSTETADVLAEVGVVLLAFAVGVDISLAEFSRIRRIALAGGGLQVVATIAVVAVLTSTLGFPTSEAVVLGFLVALSSTVIVLKVLSDRAELTSPHGQATLGVLLFQDLCVLPMMLLLPILSRPEEINALQIIATLGKALVAVGAIFYAARIVLPAVLRQVLRLGIRELFVGVVVLFCLGTAWLVAQFGVSLAIGAFVAGLVISESEYSHQVLAEILPFRDLFNSVFFISMGMLVDLQLVLDHLPIVIGSAAGIIVLKSLFGSLSVLPFTRSARIALIVGVSLAQVGEFSFVLARQGTQLGVLAVPTFQAFLTVSVLTMLLTPFLMAAAPAVAMRVTGGAESDLPSETSPSPGGHVLIIGYGLNGRNLARVLRETGIAYRILDMNAEAVRAAAKQGEPIEFGDATRPVVLRHVHAQRAAVIVVAVSDPVATRRIVSIAEELNPNADLIVRTRYVSEIEELYRLGANEVIPEEFETSVEIFARVLRRMHVPRNIIGMQVDLIRGERYAALRGLALPRQHLADLHAALEASTTETYRLLARSVAAGQSVRDLDLRRRTGVTLIAVVRGGRSFSNPSPELGLQEGDVLVLLGSHAELAAAMRLLDPPSASPAPD